MTATTRDYDYLFKLLLIGDSGVGRSSLLMRYTEDTFTKSYLATIGVDFKVKPIEMLGAKLKLQIWDTAGRERFRAITSAYYRGAHGILVCFSVADRRSFDNVKQWVDEIRKYASEDVTLMVVGAKSDLESERTVSTDEAREFAEIYGASYAETSSLTGVGVNECFYAISEAVHKRESAKQLEKPMPAAVQKKTEESWCAIC
jgi:Ras-related protein Rab-1A